MVGRMVLRPSDYSIPSPGNQYDPTSVGTYKRLAGFVVVATLLLYAWRLATNRVFPTFDSLMGRVGMSTSGGEFEVFE